MSTLAPIISFIISIVLVILFYVLILPDAKRPTLNKGFQTVHDFLKIRKLMVESIFRFMYVFAVIFTVVQGITTLFDRFWIGLLQIILGPIACRLVFELLLMGVLLVKNVMEINNHLKGVNSSSEESSISVENIFANVGKKLQDITTNSSANTPSSGSPCPKCGKAVPEESAFCIHCGTQISTE